MKNKLNQLFLDHGFTQNDSDVFFDSLIESIGDDFNIDSELIDNLHLILDKLGQSGKCDFSLLTTLNDGDLVDYHSINSSELSDHDAKCAIIKLNGGLGTSMGCTGPKSLVEVMPGKTFLDLIFDQQAVLKGRGIDLPFYVMNSPQTDQLTKDKFPNLSSFLQHRIPRIDSVSKQPVSLRDKEQEWCPPGHGDIYLSLLESGIYDELLNQGVDYVFVSNSDNLGASFDPKILAYMVKHNHDFIMETTAKRKTDVKGGTLIRTKDGLGLLEVAQVHDKDLAVFCDIERFKVFNTNNIWFNLRSMKKNIVNILSSMPQIINPKQVEEKSVIQLESAMGSAISGFENPCSILVSRDRFIPVKKTSDLLLLQSSIINKDDAPFLRYEDINHIPDIRFDDALNTVDAYNEAFEHIPDIRELDALEVKGNIKIRPGTVLKGTVHLAEE